MQALGLLEPGVLRRFHLPDSFDGGDKYGALAGLLGGAPRDNEFQVRACRGQTTQLFRQAAWPIFECGRPDICSIHIEFHKLPSVWCWLLAPLSHTPGL